MKNSKSTVKNSEKAVKNSKRATKNSEKAVKNSEHDTKNPLPQAEKAQELPELPVMGYEFRAVLRKMGYKYKDFHDSLGLTYNQFKYQVPIFKPVKSRWWGALLRFAGEEDVVRALESLREKK